MAKIHPPYAPEFRRQMVELVRAGRTPDELSREFEPSAQAIRNWVAAADRSEGRQSARPAPAADAAQLSAAERDELARLRRENKQLRLERDILSRAAAWFARETGVIPSGSSNSRARTRPLSRSPPWRACSGCYVRSKPIEPKWIGAVHARSPAA